MLLFEEITDRDVSFISFKCFVAFGLQSNLLPYRIYTIVMAKTWTKISASYIDISRN